MLTTHATTNRFQDFTTDPHWEGRGNRTAEEHARTVIQDFGYSRTNYAGGDTPGEIGGRIARSLTPATYTTVIPTKTLNDRFTASGKFAVTEADGAVFNRFGILTFQRGGHFGRHLLHDRSTLRSRYTESLTVGASCARDPQSSQSPIKQFLPSLPNLCKKLCNICIVKITDDRQPAPKISDTLLTP